MLVGKDMVMEMAVYQLAKNDKGQYLCPKCQGNLRFVDGTAVQIVDGRADMSAILPKYECHHCGIYFQELLGSGFFDEHDLPQQPKTKVLNVRRTGDLEPMILKKDVNNQCVCPRCGQISSRDRPSASWMAVRIWKTSRIILIVRIVHQNSAG